MSESFLEKIKLMVHEVADRENCVVYDFEFLGAARGRTLRVYIDRKDGTPVSIDDCTNVSKGLNLLLDVEDLIPGGSYDLEVSSPGLERALKTPAHFSGALGKTIQVKTFGYLGEYNPGRKELEKAKVMTGTLKAVGDTGVTVDLEKGPAFVPFDAITKSNMVFEVVSGEKKSLKKK